jgi:hypothetical protein
VAVQHIAIDETKPHGRKLRRGLDMLEEALTILNDEANAMPFMVDAGNYAHLEAQFGLTAGKGVTAKAELESMLAKLNTNDQVTNVNAAIQQVFNFFA